MLVEPFVAWIEGGNRHDQRPQLADGAVAAAGLNQDGVAGVNGMALAVEFHLAFAFEDVIDLGEPLMIVGLGVDADVGDVERRDAVGVVDEGSPGFAAGAGDGRQVGGAGDLVTSEW